MLSPSCLILKARRGYAGISANDGVGHGDGVGTGTGPALKMEIPQVQTRGEPLFLINYINLFNSRGQFMKGVINATSKEKERSGE